MMAPEKLHELPVIIATSVPDVLGMILGVIVLYAFLLIPMTLLAYLFGKLVLSKRIEALDDRLSEVDFESSTLRSVIGETASGVFAEKNRELAKMDALKSEVDDSISSAQDWPYDSFWEGVFWRPARQVAHIAKLLRIEWLCHKVHSGQKLKTDFERQSIEFLERYRGGVAENSKSDARSVIEQEKESVKAELREYEAGLELVREDVEDNLFEEQQISFEKMRVKQNQRFKQEAQDQEDRALEDEIEQRKLISNLLGEKEEMLKKLREQIQQVEDQREKSKDERMKRVWDLLDD